MEDKINGETNAVKGAAPKTEVVYIEALAGHGSENKHAMAVVIKKHSFFMSKHQSTKSDVWEYLFGALRAGASLHRMNEI